MRSWLLVVALGLAGCPGTPIPVNGQVEYTDAGCRVGCDKCPINSFCVSAPYQHVCVERCTSSADCPSGQQCALLDLPNEHSTGCVTADRPAWCQMQPCNVQRKCRDSFTLLQPLPYSDLVCGWEVIPCKSGCDLTTAQCK